MSPGLYVISLARRFSQDVSARASPALFPAGYVFLQSSAKIFPVPVVRAGCASNRTAVYRQARLNSRNRLIITTPPHIVNHSSPHRRKCRVQMFQSFGYFKSFRFQSFRVAKFPGADVRVDNVWVDVQRVADEFRRCQGLLRGPEPALSVVEGCALW